jgi:hypothetical protein
LANRPVNGNDVAVLASGGVFDLETARGPSGHLLRLFDNAI